MNFANCISSKMEFRARCVFALTFAVSILSPRSAQAYSVLSHEEVVDMAWKSTIVPMLRARFPGITPDNIREAHAYAYGGSVIQDIGYYPFGSHYFSDLLHYVRPNDFVETLIRDSTTPDEYAFALGALAHYCGDTIGHPMVNLVDAQQNPKLAEKYGSVVTYAENPTAHIRTEFGFDVVEVSQGHYSQDNYRDFIGFQVAQPLLERAFAETYGIAVSSIMTHEDLAINTYRKAVSSIIPKMTVVAFASYRKQIQQAAPSASKSTFIYRLRGTEYEKQYGTDYQHLSFGGHILAFFIRLMPKVGPFRSLKVNIPTPQQQDLYLKAMNATVDTFTHDLQQIRAEPAPLPIPTLQQAAAAQAAVDKLKQDAAQARQKSAKGTDPQPAAQTAQAAAHVDEVAAKMQAAATEEQEQATTGAPAPGALPPGTPIQPPTPPQLAELDLDTGRPSTVREYKLSDEAYAQLLNQLVNPPAKLATPITPTPALTADIERFYAHPAARIGPAPTAKEAKKEDALAAQVKENLVKLKKMESGTVASASQP